MRRFKNTLAARSRELISIVCRRLWDFYPGGYSKKNRIKTLLFRAFPFLFKHMANYQIWLSTKTDRSTANSGDIELFRKVEKQAKGIKTSPFDVEPEIVVTCWLAVEDPIIYGLIDLSRDLQALGLTTKFVGKTDLFRRKGCLYVQPVPLLLSDSSYEVGILSDHLPVWVEEVYQNEMVWRGEDQNIADDVVREKCNQAYYYWFHRFQSKRPAYVLVWGATSPLSRLHILLCKMLMIPYMVLERGPFLGTLHVDSIGQGVSSEKNLRLADSSASMASVEDINKILSWEKTVDESVPYARYNSCVHDDVASKLDRSGKKIIFFIGANDKGAGCVRGSNDPEQCSFLFYDTFEAVKYLKELFKKFFPNCLLMVKPHPSDKRDYSLYSSDDLLVVEGMNVNALIKLSDVCVSTSTTAFAKCIVESKPIVALAVSEFSMKNIAYECHDMTSIPVMIQAALDLDNFDEKRHAGLCYIKNIFETTLVSVDVNVPTNLEIADLARFIYRRFIATSPVASKRIAADISRHEGRSIHENTLLDIIIPVYGDVQATGNCIDSVLSSRQKIDYRVVIINDHSPCEEINCLLDKYKLERNVILLKNDANLGFVGTANRGMAYSCNRDVILLNNDTIVNMGWADRLYSHAHRSINVATVTPFSNNASIFSVQGFPFGAELHKDSEVSDFDNIFANQNAGVSVEVPVGHGFCLFVRRTCLDRVGYFDQVSFGKGYSEEIDFCLRAKTLGFTHLCACDVFVGHVGGGSFADSSCERRLKSRSVIQHRYPSYYSDIAKFVEEDPLYEYRKIVQ